MTGTSVVQQAWAMHQSQSKAPAKRLEVVPWSSKAYRQAVASLGCIKCKHPAQAAHANSLALGKGRGLKAPDYCLFPLCPEHHKEHDEYEKTMTKEQRIVMELKLIVETVGMLVADGKVLVKL